MFEGQRFWWLVFGISAAALAFALYYQYVLGDDPCVLCIHIRIYMVGLMSLGLIGALVNSTWLHCVLHWLSLALGIGLSRSCWELFGVERGFIESSCFIDAGLPAWFNLEAWFPAMFEVRGLCGQSPEIIFGWSMAEILMPSSIAATVILFVLTLLNSYSFFKTR